MKWCITSCGRPSNRSSRLDRPVRALERVRLVDADHRQPAAVGVHPVARPGQLLLLREQLLAGGEPLLARHHLGQVRIVVISVLPAACVVPSGEAGHTSSLRRARSTGAPMPRVAEDAFCISHAEVPGRACRGAVLPAHSMSDLHIRFAALSDIDAVLRFWREAAEGTSISDDHDGVAGLINRVPRSPAPRGARRRPHGDGDSRLRRMAMLRLPAGRPPGLPSARYRHRLDGSGGTALPRAGRSTGRREVLEANERAHHTWAAAGYHREDHWRRWVKSL